MVAPVVVRKRGGLWAPIMMGLMVMAAFLPFGVLFYSTSAPPMRIYTPPASAPETTPPDAVPSEAPDWNRMPPPRPGPSVPAPAMPQVRGPYQYAPRYEVRPQVARPQYSPYGETWHRHSADTEVR